MLSVAETTESQIVVKIRQDLHVLLNLSYVSWDEIFTEENVDIMFNSFLNTYLRIFYHSFPFKKSHHTHANKARITTGIKISSQHKRNLYLLYRDTKDPKLKNYYKQYCRILT